MNKSLKNFICLFGLGIVAAVITALNFAIYFKYVGTSFNWFGYWVPVPSYTILGCIGASVVVLGLFYLSIRELVDYFKSKRSK